MVYSGFGDLYIRAIIGKYMYVDTIMHGPML